MLCGLIACAHASLTFPPVRKPPQRYLKQQSSMQPVLLLIRNTTTRIQLHFLIASKLFLGLISLLRMRFLFLLFHQQQIFPQLRPSQLLRDCPFHRIAVLRCPFLRKLHHVHRTRESILCSRFLAIGSSIIVKIL